MTTTTMPATAPSAAPPRDDAIGRDDRSVLLCCDEPSYRDYLAGAARDLEFKVHFASGCEAALLRLAGRTYQVIVLLENLEGCPTLADNALLQQLSGLTTDERRQTFIALLGQSFSTGDEEAAFALSVDLLVHYGDVTQFARLLAPAYEDRHRAEQFFQAHSSDGK
jgi:CheY-like chemotaxis protein